MDPTKAVNTWLYDRFLCNIGDGRRRISKNMRFLAVAEESLWFIPKIKPSDSDLRCTWLYTGGDERWGVSALSPTAQCWTYNSYIVLQTTMRPFIFIVKPGLWRFVAVRRQRIAIRRRRTLMLRRIANRQAIALYSLNVTAHPPRRRQLLTWRTYQY